MPEASPTATVAPAIDRRDALRAALGGAAAAAMLTGPRVTSFTVAPDYASAASVCDTPTLSPWSAANSGMSGSGGPVGWQPTMSPPYTNVPSHFVERDPGLVTAQATYTSSAFALTATYNYTFAFTFQWRTHLSHGRTQTLTVDYLPPGGSWTPTSFSFQTVNSSVDQVNPGSGSFVLTPPATGNYQIRYRHTFSGVGVANDIAVTLPSVACLTP